MTRLLSATGFVFALLAGLAGLSETDDFAHRLASKEGRTLYRWQVQNLLLLCGLVLNADRYRQIIVPIVAVFLSDAQDTVTRLRSASSDGFLTL